LPLLAVFDYNEPYRLGMVVFTLFVRVDQGRIACVRGRASINDYFRGKK